MGQFDFLLLSSQPAGDSSREGYAEAKTEKKVEPGYAYPSEGDGCQDQANQEIGDGDTNQETQASSFNFHGSSSRAVIC